MKDWAGSLPPAALVVKLGGVLKSPPINVEEKIDRFVGQRTKTANALSTATSNKANAIAWRRASGGVRVPRGVHRFKTHEKPTPGYGE